MLSDHDAVPEPEASPEEYDSPDLEVPDEVAATEASEADLLDQSRVVEEEQRVTRPARRDDVPEADWLEQSVVESLDDEER